MLGESEQAGVDGNDSALDREAPESWGHEADLAERANNVKCPEVTDCIRAGCLLL